MYSAEYGYIENFLWRIGDKCLFLFILYAFDFAGRDIRRFISEDLCCCKQLRVEGCKVRKKMQGNTYGLGETIFMFS